MLCKDCFLTLISCRFEIETSPVVSTDNSLLFITGASDEVYCVEADSGRLQWAHDGGDRRYVARPVFRSPNEGDGVLYTISVSHDGT